MSKQLLKTLLVVLLGIAGFAGSYAFNRYNNQLHQTINELEAQLQKASTRLNDMVLSAQYNQILSTDSLKALSLIDTEGNLKNLRELIKEDDVIFFVKNGMCSSCVQKEFENLGRLISAYGKQKVHMLFQGFRPSYLQKDEKFKNVRSQIYEVNESPYFAGDLSGTPSFALVSATGKVKTAYHAVKSINMNFELFQEVVTKAYAY